VRSKSGNIKGGTEDIESLSVIEREKGSTAKKEKTLRVRLLSIIIEGSKCFQ